MSSSTAPPMDQRWHLVNLDKCQKSSHSGGKLGKMFLGNYPVSWVRLLAVPAATHRPGPADDYGAVPVPGGYWAGDRVILVGDHAQAWPQGVVTYADYKRINLYRHPRDDCVQEFVARCRAVAVPPPNRGGLYPVDRLWVLRNHTKKEYVRANAMPTISEGNRGDPLRYMEDGSLEGFPGIAYVLPSRLGWSEDPSASLDLSEQLHYHQGLWAGDRLDAQLWQEVEDELLYEGWTDVSRREAIRVNAMWRGRAHLDNPQALPEELPWIQE